jgi:benzoylsuccinyl-CoA thiolase BbsB subunit
MGAVVVIGVAMTRFARHPDVPLDHLGREACWAALKDAELTPRDIQAIYCGHVFQGRIVGQQIVKGLGIAGTPVYNVENACASGSTALNLAWTAVASGSVDVALALGVEQLSKLGSGVIPPDQNDLEGLLGRTNPATYALMARRHMYQYGTSIEQIAQVAVKAHEFGALNPCAQFQNRVTLEEVLGSRTIADPITLLQCCPTGDGAAAVVIASAEYARRKTTTPVTIAASAIVSGYPKTAGDDITMHPTTVAAAKKAYETAGIGPSDVDVAEVHDAFAIGEIVHLEDLGFCPKGEGGPYVASGATGLHGRKPANTSGGLLTKGHPLGATGPGQIVELTCQLRGQAGARQVGAPKVALAHCMGGVIFGRDAGVCTVHILKR